MVATIDVVVHFSDGTSHSIQMKSSDIVSDINPRLSKLMFGPIIAAQYTFTLPENAYCIIGRVPSERMLNSRVNNNDGLLTAEERSLFVEDIMPSLDSFHYNGQNAQSLKDGEPSEQAPAETPQMSEYTLIPVYVHASESSLLSAHLNPDTGFITCVMVPEGEIPELITSTIISTHAQKSCNVGYVIYCKVSGVTSYIGYTSEDGQIIMYPDMETMIKAICKLDTSNQ